MTTNDTALREKFEAWAKREVPMFDLYWTGMRYRQAAENNMWLAWQASAEEERGRVIEEAAIIAEKWSAFSRNMLENTETETPEREMEIGTNHAAAMTIARKIRALNRTDPNLVRAQHPDGVPCSCEQCTARRLAAQQET